MLSFHCSSFQFLFYLFSWQTTCKLLEVLAVHLINLFVGSGTIINISALLRKSQALGNDLFVCSINLSLGQNGLPSPLLRERKIRQVQVQAQIFSNVLQSFHSQPAWSSHSLRISVSLESHKKPFSSISFHWAKIILTLLKMDSNSLENVDRVGKPVEAALENQDCQILSS